jgi:hypothetical protein
MIFKNQSYRNCNYTKALDYKNNIPFKKQIEPVYQEGSNYIYLNEDAISNYYDKDYSKIDNEFKEPVYVSNDPRLISSAHNGQMLYLDRPPISANIKLSEVYTDPNLINYGKNYNDYTDIKNGQILYYIDKSIGDILYPPLFENPAYVTGVLYKDPMDATYPEYIRVPIKNNNALVTKNRKYEGGLSFIEQTNELKEGFGYLCLRRANRNKYSARWLEDINKAGLKNKL